MFIKQKLSIIALVVASATCVTGSAFAAGNTSTDFTATINVTSDNQCGMDVTPPTDTAFTADWTASVASGTATLDRTSTNKDARIIQVASTGGTSCTLNNVSIHTVVNADESVANIPSKAFGNNGGYWGVVPYLAALTPKDAADAPVGGVTTAVFPDNTTKEMSSVVTAADTAVTIGSLTLKMMTDSYFGNAKDTRMVADNSVSGDVTYTMATPAAQVYKLDVGVGAAIATMPVDGTGNANAKLAADGDTATIPFTVTITQA